MTDDQINLEEGSNLISKILLGFNLIPGTLNSTEAIFVQIMFYGDHSLQRILGHVMILKGDNGVHNLEG